MTYVLDVVQGHVGQSLLFGAEQILVDRPPVPVESFVLAQTEIGLPLGRDIQRDPEPEEVFIVGMRIEVRRAVRHKVYEQGKGPDAPRRLPAFRADLHEARRSE